MLTSAQQLKEVFFCPEESNFYAYCLETLVLNQCIGTESIIEFGSGDGSPVIQSLLRTESNSVVHGFELNKQASEEANLKIQKYGLSEKYLIHNSSFFDSLRPKAKYLVSNPPYLPAVDNKLYQPLLHGGLDGITVTKKLLGLDYENVLVMVSSYSNPEGLLDYALTKGYHTSNFIISPLKFGYYSSEPKVMDRIQEMKKNNMAFCSKNIYLLAGVLFTKWHKAKADLSTELLQLMTSIHE